jgi:hypothetical protein
MFDPAQKRRHDIDLWLRVIADRTWTYDTVKSMGYRENTPGSISRNELECDYYYLRALVKNSEKLASRLHQQHLSRQARRAIGIAFTIEDAGHYDRIRGLAWRHLPNYCKFFYSVAEAFPQCARRTLTLKRQITRVAQMRRTARSPVPIDT